MDETTVYKNGKTQSVKNQYLTGFQNSGWTTQPTQPVDNNLLKGGTDLTMINPKPALGATGMNADIVTSSNLNIDQYNKDLEAKATKTEAAKNTSLEDYVGGLTGQKTKTEITSDEYSKGVDLIKPELDKINADINAEVESTRQKLLKLEKNPNGLFGGALTDEMNRIETESLHRQASMAVKQMAIQGRYDSAKEIADRAVEIQFEKETNRIEALRVNYEDKKDLFTTAEQREFESKQSDRERELDQKKEDAKLMSDMSIDALKGGASADTAAKIRSAKTIEDAIKLGGKYLATADNELTEVDGRKAIVNKRTGAVKFLDGKGGTTVTQRTVNGQPVDGYTLISGDDPYFIAQKYGVDMAGLKALNPTISDWTTLKPGAVLNVPSKNAGSLQALETILGSGKFTKDQKASVVEAITNGQDPFTVIKNQAKDIMGQTNSTKLQDLETAKQQLESIDSNIKKFYAAGGESGIFSGNYEKVLNNLGKTTDPNLVAIATEIALTMQSYRLAVTGTAASVSEDAKIEAIFPGITNGEVLNNARTQAIVNSFDTKIDSTYRNVLGSSYDQLKQTQPVTVDPLQAVNEVDKKNPGLIDTIYAEMPQATVVEVYEYLKRKGFTQ